MTISPRLLWLAFLGGSLGTMLRFGAGWLSGGNSTAVTSIVILVVNLAGTAFLAWFNGVQVIPGIGLSRDTAKAFWAVGFAGGFTTMSGLALAFVLSSMSGLPIYIPVLYVVFQMIAGVGLYIWINRATQKWAAFRVAMAKVVAKAKDAA